MGVIWDQPEKRVFSSTEQAAAFKSFLLTAREMQRRKDKKTSDMTIEDIMRESEKFAKAATIEVDTYGGGPDGEHLQAIQADQGTERAATDDPAYRASDVQPVRPEPTDRETFDRVVRDLECGTGAGE